MSAIFNKEHFEYNEKFEAILIDHIEKVGELLLQIDILTNKITNFALLSKWPGKEGKEFITRPTINFKYLGKEYDKNRDHILRRLSKGDKVLKLKEEIIERLKEAEK
jgi:hypothetical protein